MTKKFELMLDRAVEAARKVKLREKVYAIQDVFYEVYGRPKSDYDDAELNAFIWGELMQCISGDPNRLATEALVELENHPALMRTALASVLGKKLKELK
jgi:hypothetical protein